MRTIQKLHSGVYNEKFGIWGREAGRGCFSKKFTFVVTVFQGEVEFVQYIWIFRPFCMVPVGFRQVNLNIFDKIRG